MNNLSNYISMIFIIILMAQVVEGKGKLMDNLSNYIIVDIGANLTNKKFSRDLDQVIQRATDSGEEDFTLIRLSSITFVPEVNITENSCVLKKIFQINYQK